MAASVRLDAHESEILISPLVAQGVACLACYHGVSGDRGSVLLQRAADAIGIYPDNEGLFCRVIDQGMGEQPLAVPFLSAPRSTPRRRCSAIAPALRLDVLEAVGDAALLGEFV